MKWRKSFIPTLREIPREGDIKSHILLLKGGFIRQVASGVYAFLPLGWRVFKKVSQIIREEMERIGAQEFYYPSLIPRELWELSGRWISFGDDMFRLKDRKSRDLSLAPTHEEVVSELIKKEIRSYKDLPQIWYQIQTKFRDEPRPRAGLLRCREFAMKDSYSLDATWEELDKSYELHYDAYSKIFKRCGLVFNIVEASTGVMGGKESHEFMVESSSGEDSLAICHECSYSANLEIAEAYPMNEEIEGKYKSKEKIHTPDVRSVQEVSEFLGVTSREIIKSILFKRNGKKVLALVRGDCEINEAKLARVLGGEVRIFESGEILEEFGVSAGFVGPLEINVDEIVGDYSVKGIKNGVVGANEDNYHIVGVTPGVDFEVKKFADIRKVKQGDLCPKCKSPLEIKNAIELGHIFKLGTRYSETMDVYYADKDGQLKPVIMGSYGIGLGRIMAAAQELYADEDGMVWPLSIAPFDIHILPLEMRGRIKDEADRLYKKLVQKGEEVLMDDRDETPGVKFKDADLLGIPLRITIGRKFMEKNLFEIRVRKTKESIETDGNEIYDKIQNIKGELLKNGNL
jgi:prolyl-tRNA synthetase